MSVTSNVILNENGDGKITGEFRDADGALVTPDTATYSLNDEDGNIINSLDGEDITGYTTSYEIELSGADLSLSALETDDKTERYLLIIATYASGQDTNEMKFYIKNLKGIKATA